MGSKNRLGTGGFEAQILDLMKDIMLRLATTALFEQCIFAKFHSCFWDMLRQKARVTPLSTCELSHYPRFSLLMVTREVDSGIDHRWNVGQFSIIDHRHQKYVSPTLRAMLDVFVGKSGGARWIVG